MSYTCHWEDCDEPAVCGVVFPKLNLVTYGCQKHREKTWRTFQEGRAIANDKLVKLGLPPVEADEGPQWLESVTA